MKKLVFACLTLVSIAFANAQTKEEIKAKREELKTQKAEKQAEADTAQKEADALQAEIDALPGWRIGAFGTIGGNLSNFNNWYAQEKPNNSSGNIGITVNGYANLIQEKYFWRNSLTTNLNWVKLDDRDSDLDNKDFEPTTDVFNVSSLFGWNITKMVAASALSEYRTTLLDNFNDPGYLDVGAGTTITPLKDLLIVIHPINYNFVFSSGDTVFESSLGAKIVIDYTKTIGAVNFKTNFSAFQSYESSDYSNWTWTNSFSYTLWKNFGVGFDFGLRDNKQEALNYTLGQDPDATFDNIDNDLQTYYTVGISYKF